MVSRSDAEQKEETTETTSKEEKALVFIIISRLTGFRSKSQSA